MERGTARICFTFFHMMDLWFVESKYRHRYQHHCFREILCRWEPSSLSSRRRCRQRDFRSLSRVTSETCLRLALADMRAALCFLAVSETARIKAKRMRYYEKRYAYYERYEKDKEIHKRRRERLDPLITVSIEIINEEIINKLLRFVIFTLNNTITF